MKFLKDEAGNNIHRFVFTNGNVGLSGSFSVGLKAMLKAVEGDVTFTITWEDATTTVGAVLLNGDEIAISGATLITVTSITAAKLCRM